MSKDLIVKDNKLIEAKYSLSTLQQKVLLQAIAKIEPTDTKFIYKFNIMEFAEAVDLKGSKTIYNLSVHYHHCLPYIAQLLFLALHSYMAILCVHRNIFFSKTYLFFLLL